jgi:hypothetical protein
MIHLQWETTVSPEGDSVSPAGDAVSPMGDLLPSPNFGICDTTQITSWYMYNRVSTTRHKHGYFEVYLCLTDMCSWAKNLRFYDDLLSPQDTECVHFVRYALLLVDERHIFFFLYQFFFFCLSIEMMFLYQLTYSL